MDDREWHGARARQDVVLNAQQLQRLAVALELWRVRVVQRIDAAYDGVRERRIRVRIAVGDGRTAARPTRKGEPECRAVEVGDVRVERCLVRSDRECPATWSQLRARVVDGEHIDVTAGRAFVVGALVFELQA